MEECQYQHYVSRFILGNFKGRGVPLYKCEEGIWTEHNPSKTGGENCLYGLKDNSLEMFFGKIENKIAPILSFSHQDKRDEALIKLFILLMAYRSPSKNKIVTDRYEKFINGIRKEISEKDICIYFEDLKKKEDNCLTSLEDDPEMRNIIDELPKIPYNTDDSKNYTLITQELLQVIPRISKCFKIQIFESDNDLIIGETPTLSVNLDTNEVKLNGEEAGIENNYVMYWLPIAFNLLGFNSPPFRAVNDH